MINNETKTEYITRIMPRLTCDKRYTKKHSPLRAWVEARLYGEICTCGFSIPHDSERLKKEERRKSVVCYGPTHPSFS